MKRLILITILFLISSIGCASTVPAPEQQDAQPITRIPRGIEIRQDLPILLVACGEPRALIIRSSTGTQIFVGDGMNKTIVKLHKIYGPPGIPIVRVDLSKNNNMCDASDALDFGGKDYHGEPTWSAKYQR